MDTSFDRAAEDVGNIVALEHVNLCLPDQAATLTFYVEGLCLTRDPFMTVGPMGMWVNAGTCQFHLIQRAPAQVLRGTIGLVTPHLDTIRRRLPRVVERLSGTHAACAEADGALIATDPWGNRIRLHSPGTFGRMDFGIAYVEFLVPPGTSDGIARFYREVLGAKACLASGPEGAIARVTAGPAQHLLFRETAGPVPAYDGHHIQVYVSDFSPGHRWLAERGLVMEESDPCQYRFVQITDPASGALLYELEHEVRSLTSPLFGRRYSLVNRNPEQRGGSAYTYGADAYTPA